jgi:hypothetical protein
MSWIFLQSKFFIYGHQKQGSGYGPGSQKSLYPDSLNIYPNTTIFYPIVATSALCDVLWPGGRTVGAESLCRCR